MKIITPKIILVFYDYPQVFIGKDDVDLQYVCMAISENKNGPVYICIPISQSKIGKLCTSKIDLREAYLNPETEYFFECLASENNTSLYMNRLNIDKCPAEYLPEEGLFLNGYDEVSSKALELNSTIAYVSLSVLEAENSPRIRSNKLSEFLTLYQNAIKYLTKLTAKESKVSTPKGETPYSTDVFGFSYGSFTIQLRSSYDGDLLGDNALLAGALKKLNEIISLTNNTEDAIEYLQNIKGHTAASLIKLFEFISQNSCPIKHQWATPSMDKSNVASANLANIHELVKLCRQRDDLFSEEVSFVGIFSIANSDANTWKIIDDNGDSHSGCVHPDSNITMNGVIIRAKKYQLSCKETIEIVLGTSKEVKTLLLTELVEIT